MNYPKYVDEARIQCFSYDYPDDKYRFKLVIPFKSENGKGLLRVIMKNPSTASAEKCDQTVMKVCSAVKEAGFDGVIILNLFPFRATNAVEVYNNYFIGNPDYERSMKKNLEVIRKSCTDSEVFFAWGTNTISGKKEFRTEYDKQIDKVITTVSKCASHATGVNLSLDDSSYYFLHGLRWWKTILKETFGERDDETADDCMPIIVTLAMSAEQAKKENCVEALEPPLPNPKDVYFMLDSIPDELCISKELGWRKIICAYKRNAEKILKYMYPNVNEINIPTYLEVLKKIDGDKFYILGFGD